MSERFEEARADAVLDRRYRLRREIARGGMGCVFEAEHLVTRARAAIKTLHRPALDTPAVRARLTREGRVLGMLRHPSIVTATDAGECPTFGPYLALEMIEGRPLDGMLAARRTLPVDQSVALIVQLCEALDHVHRMGVVHRDVKSGNVLVASTPRGDQVELIDFGIASVGLEDDVTTEKLTRAGELLGTVDSMAPEQLIGRRAVDHRADIYAAGVLLYECLTGDVPYPGTPAQVIAQVVAKAPPSPMRSVRDDVPTELEAAVRRALALDPADRWASARELAEACTAALGGNVPALSLLEPRCAATRDELEQRRASPTCAETPRGRRQFARAPYVSPVRLLLAGGGVCDGRVEDVSEGGVLIVTDGLCQEGERVTVRLPLPASGRVVSVAATTRWVRSQRSQRAIGAEFRDLPDDARREIRAYVGAMRHDAPVDPSRAPGGGWR